MNINQKKNNTNNNTQQRHGVFQVIFSLVVLCLFCGLTVISTCYAVTPSVAGQVLRNQLSTNNNNNDVDDKSPQEFTYIKNLIHSQGMYL